MTAYAGVRADAMRTEGKIAVAPEDACAEAERFVLATGFVFDGASGRSEARYFRFPGRLGVLRIAAHRKGARNGDMRSGPAIASVTFSRKATHDGLLRVSKIYVEWQTATAIGLYMMRAKSVRPLGNVGKT